jgi:hypothetical protein
MRASSGAALRCTSISCGEGGPLAPALQDECIHGGTGTLSTVTSSLCRTSRASSHTAFLSACLRVPQLCTRHSVHLLNTPPHPTPYHPTPSHPAPPRPAALCCRKFLGQASFPLTEEEYDAQLGAVAEYLTMWGVTETVRSGIAGASKRGPGCARCLGQPTVWRIAYEGGWVAW